MKPDVCRPPASWLVVVRALVPTALWDEIEGDLIEGWQDRADRPRWQRAWAFWRDALSVAIRHRERSAPESRAAMVPSGWQWSRDFSGDLRIALRSLGRRRGFTLTAVATLALGLGANGAVFALAWHTSLFRSWPSC